jgi:hypothetical protein
MGLSGTVDCLFDCFPKGREFDTQHRRLVFAQKISLNVGNSIFIKIETNFLGKNQAMKLGIEPAIV